MSDVGLKQVIINFFQQGTKFLETIPPGVITYGIVQTYALGVLHTLEALGYGDSKFASDLEFFTVSEDVNCKDPIIKCLTHKNYKELFDKWMSDAD